MSVGRSYSRWRPDHGLPRSHKKFKKLSRTQRMRLETARTRDDRQAQKVTRTGDAR